MFHFDDVHTNAWAKKILGKIICIIWNDITISIRSALEYLISTSDVSQS